MREAVRAEMSSSISSPVRGLKTVAAYGEWLSPLTATKISSAGKKMLELQVSPSDGKSAFYCESRPTEGGRYVVMSESGSEASPEGHNVRTRVHEYGGGAWCLLEGTGGEEILYSNFSDQRPQLITIVPTLTRIP